MVLVRNSDMLVEGFGVNTHWGIPENSYDENQATVVAAMAELGVRYYRDFPLQTAALRELAASLYFTYGMKQLACCAAGSASENWTTLQAYATPDIIVGVEGRNEPSLAAAPAAGTHMASIHGLVRSDPSWNNVKLIAPSPIARDAYSAMGNLVGKVTRYNVHPYPGGYGPELYFNSFGTGSYVPPETTGVFWITETGYHTKTDQIGFQGVPDYVAAQYLPRTLVLFLTHDVYNFEKVFFYEMLCSRQSGLASFEQTFGLLNQDGSRRPQFNAMKALIGTMSDKGAAFTPDSINVILSGANPTVIYRVFQKSTKDFYMLIWNNRNVWNPATQSDVVVAELAETVQTSVKGTAAIMRINDKVPAWQPVAVDLNGKIQLNVSTGISIIRISN